MSDSSARNLGPISPELALVDPALAEQARRALPDPPDVLQRRPPPARAPAPAPPIEPSRSAAHPPPEALPRRRRAAPLLAIGFVAGGLFGGLVGARSADAPRPTFGAVPATITSAPTDAPASSTAPTPQSGTTPQKPQKQKQGHVPRHGRRAGVEGVRRGHAPLPLPPPRAANVLGVEATVSGRTVTLVWRAPANSKAVVVLRSRGTHGRRAVVYRGRAGRYRDAVTRSCTAYRYMIVNYDRKGRASTGVPTSVVTSGCR